MNSDLIYISDIWGSQCVGVTCNRANLWFYKLYKKTSFDVCVQQECKQTYITISI